MWSCIQTDNFRHSKQSETKTLQSAKRKILGFAGPPHERSALSQQIGMRLYPFALIYILDRIEGQGEATLR